MKQHVIDPPEPTPKVPSHVKAKPSKGHSPRKPPKNGKVRSQVRRSGASARKTPHDGAQPPAPTLARALSAVYRPSRASQEVAGAADELAIRGIALQFHTLSVAGAAPKNTTATQPSAAFRASLAAPRQPVVPETAADVSAAAEKVEPTPIAPIAPIAVEPGTAPAAARPFRPRFEVDRFSPSEDCDLLERVASHQLDGLARQIAEEAGSGRNVVGIAGCRRGDGCTTLLLSIAPRLVGLDRRVLLVDADFHNPTLARRLGLVPESGWEEVLAGSLPPSEAIVESLEDRLALLPLREPPAGGGYALGGHPDPSVSLRPLTEHYDVLLVDVGRFHQHDSGSNLPQPNGRWIAALLLVRNVRSTSEEDLARNRQRVRAAGIYEVGIVENFA